MADQRPLRWGLVGASDIAETGMLPAMRRVGHATSTLFSNSAQHAAVYAERNAIGRVASTLDALLGDHTIDAVYISSVNELHQSQALAAAAAGKHVLCEKPISTSSSDARSMVSACRSAGVVLAVNHHLPAAGTHTEIRRVVAAGTLGRVLAVDVQHAGLLPDRLVGWRLDGSPGAGAVMDLSVHDASVVNALLGSSALDVVAMTARQGHWDAHSEDVAMSVLRYPNDVLVKFHDSFTSPFTPTRLAVHGTDGSIFATDVMTPQPVGTVTLRDAGGQREVPVTDRRHPYDITLEAFAKAVHGDGYPIVSGEDAVDALLICEAIKRSATSGTRQDVQAF